VSSEHYPHLSAGLPGSSAVFQIAMKKKETPSAIRKTPKLLAEFQNAIRQQGVETEWQT
jgi:hypothetical protein